MLHPLPLPLSSCLGYIPPLRATFPAFLCGWLQFVSTVCVIFVHVLYFSRRCPLLATSCPSFFCLLTMLISDSRFDLVWFRLSCDHGWIRSGSVNVRKQQQQQQVRCICFCVVLFLFCFCLFLFMLVSWGGCDKISLVVIARIKLFGLMRGAYIF